MEDKFSKVKRAGVIIWGEFSGFWRGRVVARRGETGHSVQHTGGGAKWVWARVTAAFLFGWEVGRVVVVPAQAGLRPALGRRGVRGCNWKGGWLWVGSVSFRWFKGVDPSRRRKAASAAANRFRLSPE